MREGLKVSTEQLEAAAERAWAVRGHRPLFTLEDDVMPRATEPTYHVMKFDRVYEQTHRGRVTEADHALEEMRLPTKYCSAECPPGLVCSARLGRVER